MWNKATILSVFANLKDQSKITRRSKLEKQRNIKGSAKFLNAKYITTSVTNTQTHKNSSVYFIRNEMDNNSQICDTVQCDGIQKIK